MCSDYVISLKNISKTYNMYGSPADRLKHSISSHMRQRAPTLMPEWFDARKYVNEFNAVKGINLVIYPGETIGIVGCNGSGKSTLLQMICGTLLPSTGVIRVNGRTAALLELGSGFNPDFTGRENVYLNGAILGMTKRDVDNYFDEIVAFADIGIFLDQPVRTYSSGMFVRLAFAVSICLEPDILIVDEALAVGDEAFQRKCYARIKNFQEGGGTILFVTHSMGTIVELCDRALLMDAGEMVMLSDSPKEVVSAYHKLSSAPAGSREEVREMIKTGKESESTCDHSISETDQLNRASFDLTMKSQSVVEYISRGARIINPRLLDEHNDQVNVLFHNACYTYTYNVLFSDSFQGIRFGMLVKTVSGLEIGGVSLNAARFSIERTHKNMEVEVRFIFFCKLLPGTFFLNAGTSAEIDGERQFLHRITDVLMFKVEAAKALESTGIVDFSVKADCSLCQ